MASLFAFFILQVSHNMAEMTASEDTVSVFGKCSPVSTYSKLNTIGEGTYGEQILHLNGLSVQGENEKC